jgi:RimJ/RimL family protein N-acetyltransferase
VKKTVINTDRLTLRRLTYDDSDFILELVNEPSFKKYIGDKRVKNLDDARAYLRNGAIGHYESHGFGLYLVSSISDGERLGICGLVKRDEFDTPDLGFAFLHAHWSKGFALESARAVLDYGSSVLGLKRIIAMADSDNHSSTGLLDKLGFEFERMVKMPGETVEICLYSVEY